MSERDSERVPGAAGQDVVWPVGPDTPRLKEGVAHVWRADLRAVSDDVLAGLTADERKRAGSIHGERERMLWARSRAVLRELLGRYLQRAGGAVELAVGTHGKPELVSADELPAELFFNLSHSRHLALFAFSVDGPVGVDVQAAREERTRSNVDHIALARRAFGEHEAQRLSLVDPARREWEFLRAWSCHEAELKRVGTGIGPGDADDEGIADPTSSPWIVELGVGSLATAALALGWRPGELRRWSWA
jgi:4'-phosphopantetheinyl transferase